MCARERVLPGRQANKHGYEGFLYPGKGDKGNDVKFSRYWRCNQSRVITRGAIIAIPVLDSFLYVDGMVRKKGKRYTASARTFSCQGNKMDLLNTYFV